MTSKLEKIARIGLGALIGVSVLMERTAYSQDEKKIVWRAIPKNLDGSENFEWKAGEYYKLEIWVDNWALEGKKTGTFYWAMSLPSDMRIVSTEFIKDSNSFFYGMEMNNDWSRIGIEGRSFIGTRTFYDPYSGNGGHDGVPNRRGSIGNYTIKVDENSRAGNANFVFSQMEARSNSTNGVMEFPYIKTKIAGVSILNPANTNPVVSLSSSWENDYLAQVAGEAGKRYVLEKSFDLRNWTPISTNTGSFTWADKDAERLYQKYNFYRALSKAEADELYIKTKK